PRTLRSAHTARAGGRDVHLRRPRRVRDPPGRRPGPALAGGDPHRGGNPRASGAPRWSGRPRPRAHAHFGLRSPHRVRRPGRGLPGTHRGARAAVSPDSEQAAERIVLQGRQELQARLRAAILRQAGSAAEPITLEAAHLDELVEAASARAGGVLWRRCLAGAATTELGIDLADAISHPTVQRAHELAGAPSYEAIAEPVVPVAPAEQAGAATQPSMHAL